MATAISNLQYFLLKKKTILNCFECIWVNCKGSVNNYSTIHLPFNNAHCKYNYNEIVLKRFRYGFSITM